MGCQTVLISRNAVIGSRPGSAVQSGTEAGARRTRLRFSAAACSSETVSVAVGVAGEAGQVDRVDVHVAASQGAVVAGSPVRMLTTPPGTSLVARTSAKVTAGSGREYDDIEGPEPDSETSDQTQALAA